MPATKELTPKQKMFVAEYLCDLNSTAAARRAGYSPRTAEQQGSRLLSNVNVSAYVKEENEKRFKKLDLSAEWVLEKLKECVAKSMQEEEVQKWDYEDKCLAGTGEYVYDSKGATKALELIGKHLGMFKDNLNITGSMSVKIVDDIEK